VVALIRRNSPKARSQPAQHTLPVEIHPWLTAESFLITIALDRGDDGAGQT
jgi:hypothetical protein